jgi:hypothetical protein
MKAVDKNSLFLYLLATSITGSLYKLLESTENENLIKIIAENLVFIGIAFIFSYLGYITGKGKSKEQNPKT